MIVPEGTVPFGAATLSVVAGILRLTVACCGTSVGWHYLHFQGILGGDVHPRTRYLGGCLQCTQM
jgi:hypothetical protein